MIYTKRYTIRWHDTDSSRNLTPTHLLMYMEETSDFHLRDAGMTLDELRDRRGLAFLLSRIAVGVYEQLHVGEEIDVETWICESRGMSFLRCYRVLKNGKTVAEAYSVWALLDLVRQKLLPTSEFPYEIEPEAPLGAELTARVRFPSTAGMELVGDRKIVYSDIDYNGHMNNTHYPNMLCDFTPDILSKNVTGFTLSFLHEAAFGHTLKVYRSEREGGGYFFRTQDEAGNVCLEAMLLTEEKQSLGEKSRNKTCDVEERTKHERDSKDQKMAINSLHVCKRGGGSDRPIVCLGWKTCVLEKRTDGRIAVAYGDIRH